MEKMGLFEQKIIEDFIRSMDRFMPNFVEQFNRAGKAQHGEELQETCIVMLVLAILKTTNISKEKKQKLLQTMSEKL